MVKGIERVERIECVERGYGMWLRSFLCVYMTVYDGVRFVVRCDRYEKGRDKEK